MISFVSFKEATFSLDGLRQAMFNGGYYLAECFNIKSYTIVSQCDDDMVIAVKYHDGDIVEAAVFLDIPTLTIHAKYLKDLP